MGHKKKKNRYSLNQIKNSRLIYWPILKLLSTSQYMSVIGQLSCDGDRVEKKTKNMAVTVVMFLYVYQHAKE